MKITRELMDGTWETDGEFHCPRCGKNEVWWNSGRNDYYQGDLHLCLACGGSFYFNARPEDDPSLANSLAQLRAP